MQAITPFSGSASNVCYWTFEGHTLSAVVHSLVLFYSSFEAANAVLPSYIPALGVAHRGRDSLVQQYFDLGLNYVEIIFFFTVNSWNKSQAIKENSSKERPQKATNYSDPAEVVAAVDREPLSWVPPNAPKTENRLWIGGR